MSLEQCNCRSSSAIREVELDRPPMPHSVPPYCSAERESSHRESPLTTEDPNRTAHRSRLTLFLRGLGALDARRGGVERFFGLLPSLADVAECRLHRRPELAH